MSEPKDVEISLKVMINEGKTKVLFAEADADFVDVLLSFLTLPLGTIVRVLNKHKRGKCPTFGSLTNLYQGLADLDSSSFWSEGAKQMLLNPRNSFQNDCHRLKFNVDDTQPANYFRCGDVDCKRRRSAIGSMYHDTVKCDCGKYMRKAMGTIGSKAEFGGDSGCGVFTDKHVTFLISDDLRMAPAVPGSMIQTLINLGITVTNGAELRTVNLGFNDFMDFLGESLHSSTPLTDLVLHKSCTSHGLVGDCDLQHHRLVGSSSSLDSKKMIVRAWVQNFDRKLLFVQAEEDFVDFLFGLLIISLGGVECLLGGSTSLKNIDNLYTSVANLIEDKYLKTNIKSRLMKPELPPGYLSKNQIFSLGEQPNPAIYFFESIAHSPEYTVEKGSWMHFKDPKGKGTYVKRPGKFLVHSNLSVTRCHSTKSVFEELDNCSTDDVEELELHIGLEEALNILKASLTSKGALSDGLSNQISEKLQAKEHRGKSC